MKLYELFETLDSSIRTYVDTDEENCYIVKAKVANHVKIEFTATRRSIKVAGKWVWEVVFTEEGVGGYALTGKGSEFKVFSMIKQCMEDLIKKHSPDVIKFTARKEDRSRASVYERMLKRFLKGYSITIYDSGPNIVTFKLEKQ